MLDKILIPPAQNVVSSMEKRGINAAMLVFWLCVTGEGVKLAILINSVARTLITGHGLEDTLTLAFFTIAGFLVDWLLYIRDIKNIAERIENSSDEIGGVFRVAKMAPGHFSGSFIRTVNMPLLVFNTVSLLMDTINLYEGIISFDKFFMSFITFVSLFLMVAAAVFTGCLFGKPRIRRDTKTVQAFA